MAKEFLRRIDRWRFEAPLALVLGCAAGFAASAMPQGLLSRIPLLGEFGFVGRAAIALGLGILCGMGGYAMMRGPAAAKPEPEPEIEDIDFTEAEVVVATPAQRAERMRRARKADAHPDAPLRAPIRASRDLGEPFMEVNAFPQPEGEEPAIEPEAIEAVSAPVEETDTPVAEAEPAAAPEEAPAPAAAEPEPVEAARRDTVVRADRQSLNEMIDRLSAGLERRARRAGQSGAAQGQPQRDVRPAMREALEELNRLAAARQR